MAMIEEPIIDVYRFYTITEFNSLMTSNESFRIAHQHWTAAKPTRLNLIWLLRTNLFTYTVTCRNGIVFCAFVRYRTTNQAYAGDWGGAG